MEGKFLGYSCPGCGTREQVRELWQTIACFMCQWESCAVLLGHQMPLWGDVLPLPRFSVGSRPWHVAQRGMLPCVLMGFSCDRSFYGTAWEGRSVCVKRAVAAIVWARMPYISITMFTSYASSRKFSSGPADGVVPARYVRLLSAPRAAGRVVGGHLARGISNHLYNPLYPIFSAHFPLPPDSPLVTLA
jgi:hypothetical protein